MNFCVSKDLVRISEEFRPVSVLGKISLAENKSNLREADCKNWEPIVPNRAIKASISLVDKSADMHLAGSVLNVATPVCNGQNRDRCFQMVANWSLIECMHTDIADLCVSSEGQKSASNSCIVQDVDDDRKSQCHDNFGIQEANQGGIAWHLKLIRMVNRIFHVLQTLANNFLSLRMEHSCTTDAGNRFNHLI